MKRGKLNPFDDINQFWEYEKEREKEEAKLKLLAGEMRMANSSDALGKYHCSMKKKVIIKSGVYKVEYPFPRWGQGNKIKGFGNGEENLKLEKKKKENL